jgi:GNAT superfamily N-acetyltransferase
MELVEFITADLDSVLRLCQEEGWPSLPSDPARALRVLTCPGSTTVVARNGAELAGVCQLLSDGELQAYCPILLVERGQRGRGIGRSLLLEAFARAGGERLDLISEPGTIPFYRRLRHQEWTGFRVYPQA